MHREYLSYVVRHKRFVYREGRKLGVGRWQLLVHDLSKFRPSEWFPYARFFYGGTYPTQHWCDTIGVPFTGANPLTTERVKADFDRAWLLHQHRNPHHYQFWVLREDSGETKCLPMPDKYRREMLADWRGAGAALGKPDTRAWYLRNRDHISLHPETRAWVEAELGFERARRAAP